MPADHVWAFKHCFTTGYYTSFLFSYGNQSFTTFNLARLQNLAQIFILGSLTPTAIPGPKYCIHQGWCIDDRTPLTMFERFKTELLEEPEGLAVELVSEIDF